MYRVVCMCQSVATTADIMRSYTQNYSCSTRHLIMQLVASLVHDVATHQVDVPVFIMLNNLAKASQLPIKAFSFDLQACIHIIIAHNGSTELIAQIPRTGQLSRSGSLPQGLAIYSCIYITVNYSYMPKLISSNTRYR